MRRMILHLLCTTAAIGAAVYLIDGVSLVEPWRWWHLVLVGIVFGVLNALVKPVLTLFSLPVILLTLGLFYLVINAVILWLTAALVPILSVSGFVPALLGSLVISVVNWVLGGLIVKE